MNSKDKQNPEAEMPSRRRLLKQATFALPIVATIPSGAALARSSNLIGFKLGGDPDANATSAASGNRVLCMSKSSAELDYTARQADLGPFPNPTGVALPPGEYQSSGPKISAAEACEAGGTFSYKSSSPPRDMAIPTGGGVVVSATALSSFVIASTFQQL
jgi:hypothetical protein